MVPWQQILGAAVRGAVTTATGGGDYTYRRLSRRTATAPNIVLPSRQRVIPEIAVVIDTSGSVDERMLGQGPHRTRQHRVHAADLERGSIAVSVDTSAYNLRRVRRATDIDLFGGGGTDMTVGIAAVAAQTAAPGGRHCVHRRLHTVAGPTDRRNNPRCSTSRLPRCTTGHPGVGYPRRMCR